MATYLRRREFVVALGSAAAAWPLAARAQTSGKTYRIGYLGMAPYPRNRRQLDALRTGLRQLGWEEGKDIVFEYRWAEEEYDRLHELAAELVKLNVDVIVAASGTPAAQAAKRSTSTIPIVTISGDPIAAGLVSSLARPGGNVTGLTFFFTEINAKRVELIKEAVPTLTRVAVLVNPSNASHRIALTAMHSTAGAIGVELVPMEAKARVDIAAAIAAATTRRAPALVAIEDALFVANASHIAEVALQNGLPMIGFKPQAEAGALLEYGVDLADLFSRSAALVDKILRGTSPANLPIERAVKFEVIVNLKSARTLGIELPTSLLLRANEVIE
jgi:putative ABC transport system substrate-binding protein